jgi:hypothetical protein
VHGSQEPLHPSRIDQDLAIDGHLHGVDQIVDFRGHSDDPANLKRTWESLKIVMGGDGALDPLMQLSPRLRSQPRLPCPSPSM